MPEVKMVDHAGKQRIQLGQLGAKGVEFGALVADDFPVLADAFAQPLNLGRIGVGVERSEFLDFFEAAFPAIGVALIPVVRPAQLGFAGWKRNRIALVLGGWLGKNGAKLRERGQCCRRIPSKVAALEQLSRHADHLFGVAGSVFCGHGDTSRVYLSKGFDAWEGDYDLRAL
ncbi:hypothetical protein D3C77_253670 [compost metagenome]